MTIVIVFRYCHNLVFVFLVSVLLLTTLDVLLIHARCPPPLVEDCYFPSIPAIVDSEDNEITDIFPGKEVYIKSTILGRENTSYVYIVPVKDNNGFTEQLSWKEDSIKGDDFIVESVRWKPLNTVEYLIGIACCLG